MHKLYNSKSAVLVMLCKWSCTDMTARTCIDGKRSNVLHVLIVELRTDIYNMANTG